MGVRLVRRAEGIAFRGIDVAFTSAGLLLSADLVGSVVQKMSKVKYIEPRALSLAGAGCWAPRLHVHAQISTTLDLLA